MVFIASDLRPNGLPDGNAPFGIPVSGQESASWAGCGHGFASLLRTSRLSNASSGRHLRGWQWRPSHSTPRRSGPGVVVFDEATPELHDFCAPPAATARNAFSPLRLVARSLTGGSCWRLLQCGAADVLQLGDSPAADAAIAARLDRWATISRLVGSPLVRDACIGQSPAWSRLLHQIVEVAYFSDSPVLITGESGTGKELVCRLVHALDQRPDKRDLVVLDCTTIAPELSGSEFFGHERGAFTGAVAARDGAFALADGGTLFLDEVGELPPPLQAELLRVIQEHTYKRVGSNTWQTTRFRLVCATNRDLLEEVARGRFRQDLYYRIAGWSRRLPPLRERPEDILSARAPLHGATLPQPRRAGTG